MTGAGGVIGRAIIARLVADGVRVIAVDRSETLLAELAGDKSGIVTVVGDVREAAVIEAAFGQDWPVDILINNAGVADGGAALDELSEEIWDIVIDVNLTAAFRWSRRAIPGMLANGHGVIVNMASVAGLRGGRTGLAYTASKWALVGMVQNIAALLGPEGIRAVAVCPANVAGPFSLGDTPATERAIRNRTRDNGRTAASTGEDVAELVAFLTSDRARHINGVAVPLDQGWIAY